MRLFTKEAVLRSVLRAFVSKRTGINRHIPKVFKLQMLNYLWTVA